MTLKKALHKSLGGIIGMLLALILGALFTTLGVGAMLGIGKLGAVLQSWGVGLQHLSYELPFANRKVEPPQDVVLVYLDDRSHQLLNQPYNRPWDRKLHARLLQRLKQDGAKAAVFDIVFSDPSDPEADKEFAQAIGDFGKVVLAADWVHVQNMVGSTIVLPHEPFMDAAAAVGIAEMQPDPDQYLRRHFPGIYGELISSLSWAAAELAGAEITKHEDQKFKERWINYYGPPNALPSVSFYRAVAVDPRDELPAGFFKDKIVFVGARLYTNYSGERKDEYRSPYTFWLDLGRNVQMENINTYRFMSGVEIQATVFLNLLRGDWLTRVSPSQDRAIVLIAGAVIGFVLGYVRPTTAAAIGPAFVAAIVLIGYYCFVTYGIWFSWVLLAFIQVPVSTIWGIIFNSVNLFLQKRLMEQSVSMYVSPSRVKQISLNPDKLLKPGAEKQELSILFSDIANFTTMSEGMDSDELAHMMNQYFETAVGSCIHKVEGTVVKFIGDAIFAIWNAPEPQQNHQELACRGALLLRDQVTDFKFSKPKPGLEVRTRIGLHCGVANVGNFGSSTRIDYTAIGENINLASRMEGLNKYLGTSVLITGDVYAHVKDKFVTRFCGKFQLKGFERAVDVHELLGTMDQAEASREWREVYNSALKAFQANDLDAAERGFKCVRQMHPNDGPAGFFLKHIRELRAHPPEGPWTGTVELKEK